MMVPSPPPRIHSKQVTIDLIDEGTEEHAVKCEIGDYLLEDRIPQDPPSRSAAHGKRGKRFLRWGQYFFLLVGLLAAGYCGWFYGEAQICQAYQSWRFDQIRRHQPSGVKDFLASYLSRISIALTNRPAHSSVKISAESPSPNPPKPPLSEGALIGRIEVPRLGLSTMVLEGDSEEVLHKAVGHIPGTALPGGSGNVAIAGHRDTFFRALRDIRRNDSITLETTAGTYNYRVRSVQIVEPYVTQVLAPSDRPSLTLITCYPFYFVGSAPERYIVNAQQIESSRDMEKKPSPNPAFSSESNSPSEVNLSSEMAQDPLPRNPVRRAQRRPRAHRASPPSGDSDEDGRIAEYSSPVEPERPFEQPSGVPGRTAHSRNPARRLVSWVVSLLKRVAGD
jgi:sortase A